MGGRVTAVCCTVGFVLLASGASAQQQKIGDPPEASNVKLVGTDDLQGRSAYQPTIHHQGDRWIAYIGHHGGTDDIPDPVNPMTGKAEPNGTSIVDVTDPAHPKYLRHIPGQEGKYESGGAQMVRICDGKDLPKGDRNAVYMLRAVGSQGHEIWNVADPANPVLVTRIGEGLKDTHKNWWECDTGIAYLVSGAPDWRTRRMTQVYDLSDPAHPVKIRDFGLPGQEPGATGAVPTELHGPISTGPKGNRIYFGYGTDKGGFLQIVDRDKLLNGPKEPTPDNLKFPEIARMPMSALNGAHTVFPMPDMPIAEFARDKDGKTRDIVMIVDEAIQNECGEARQMVWFADVTTEARPMMISSYTVPEASGSFCERGGRFGSHSSNESMAPVYYKKMAFIAFFNAGVRALDIRDPYHPREVGYFIPSITSATDKRCVTIGGKDRCKVAIQTNNVETDERGYIYIVDRANTGLHILELTGDARTVAGLP
ncbi:LVIVD repeat-containing protein [Bradyrhizobium genosp. P]|uniref:LVIVD repeat-containing protein n=1 Tax=Bradyrhizobium genosp. P TaxID=83641 RepID=UPI003CF336D3